jgi:hypothetical protein
MKRDPGYMLVNFLQTVNQNTYKCHFMMYTSKLDFMLFEFSRFVNFARDFTNLLLFKIILEVSPNL